MAPVPVVNQVLDVGVMKIAGSDVGAYEVERIAPDIPGPGRQLVVAVVEFQIVMNVMRDIGRRGAGLQRQSARPFRGKRLSGQNLSCKAGRKKKGENREQTFHNPILLSIGKRAIIPDGSAAEPR